VAEIFYINDKPTGGGPLGNNLFGALELRERMTKQFYAKTYYVWVSPRLIKETFVTPVDYRYPFLG